MFGFGRPTMVDAADALAGQDNPIAVPERHAVLDAPLTGPWPAGYQVAVVAMGCFWGAERIFWEADGVHSTAVGYAGGFTPNPTYEQVCTGRTGHTEAVQVVFDPETVTYAEILKLFFENHDPTQGFRQGNDTGTQYRSAILTTSEEQEQIARATKESFQPIVTRAGGGDITTEISPLKEFFYAEEYHQQYLHKIPNGYCNHGPNGLTCPVGIATAERK